MDRQDICPKNHLPGLNTKFTRGVFVMDSSDNEKVDKPSLGNSEEDKRGEVAEIPKEVLEKLQEALLVLSPR